MSACPAFEDRLLEYDELPSTDRITVDAHLTICPGCREYLQLLGEVDAALFASLRDARFAGQRFVDMRQLVAADTPVAAVSRLPECLDFVATCAVFAFGYGLAWQTGLIAYLVSTLSSSPN
jgi:anti-sigma factor RsiW